MKRILPGTRALRTFEAAARHLNFTRAADEVGLSAAAVSHQIKELEDQLGAPLFVRTSRTMRLTPAGVTMYGATQAALDGLHRAAAQARRQAGDDASLRLTVMPRLATNWLFPRLPAFQAAHPHVQLAFDIADDVRDFGTDDVDVAIRFGPGHYPGTASVRLFDTALVAACHPRLADVGTPAALRRHTLCHVTCTAGAVRWPGWREWMAAAGVDGFDDRACVAFQESSHVVQAAVDGGAIGLVELPMVARELAEGRLMRLFDIALPVGAEYAYHLVYPEAAATDARIAALREWLLAEIGTTPPARRAA